MTSPPDPRLILSVSSVEWPATEGTISKRVNAIDTAELALPLPDGTAEFDLAAESALIARNGKGESYPQVRGYVSAASSSGKSAKVNLRGSMTVMEESLISGFAQNMSHLEWMSFVLSRSGFPVERQNIQGFVPPPPTVYHALVPLTGVVMESSAFRIGRTTIYGPREAGSADRTLALAYPDQPWAALSFDARARVHVTANSFDDAIVLSRAAVQKALDWLVWRLSMSRIPWYPKGYGPSFPRWSRRLSLMRPQPLPWTYVERPRTGSTLCWNDSLTVPAEAGGEDLASYVRPGFDEFARILTLPDDVLAAGERRMLLALRTFRQAVEQPTPIEVVVGLWTTIEYLVAGDGDELLFSKEELRAVKQAMSALTAKPDQVEALNAAVANLNRPTLRKQIARFVAAEAIRLSAADQSVLDATRNIRNDVVHGRQLHDIDEPQLVVLRGLVSRFIWARARQLDRLSS